MVLLLTGASETARSLVVDKILDEYKDWKHLALEDLREDGSWEEDAIGVNEVLGAVVACECAKQEHDRGHSVVITCPALALLETVYEAFPRTVSVYMGTDRRISKQFDVTVDPKKSSVNATYVMLKKKVIRD